MISGDGQLEKKGGEDEMESSLFFGKTACGASISIASGQERVVPKNFESLEFLWRLRSDPVRRITRLIESIIYFTKGKYFQKKLKSLNIYTID